MIFLTVGTTGYRFNRLLRVVDLALDQLPSREKLVVQMGSSVYKFAYKNSITFRTTSFTGMISLLKRARLVVAHAGMGTVLLATKFCQNKPILVPRRKEFAEHVDDHQRFMDKLPIVRRSCVFLDLDGDRLVARLKRAFQKPETMTRYKEGRSNSLNTKLVRYTEFGEK